MIRRNDKKKDKETEESEWNKALEEVKISKQDLNKIIMNYLVVEGYQSAAQKFTQE